MKKVLLKLLLAPLSFSVASCSLANINTTLTSSSSFNGDNISSNDSSESSTDVQHGSDNISSSSDSSSSRHTHNYTEISHIDPTNDSAGIIIYECSGCGDQYSVEDGTKLEHSYSTEWTYDNDFHWHACIDSGYESSFRKDFSEHNYGSWVIDVAPSSTIGGSHHKECITCGHRVSESIPPLSHIHTPGETVIENEHYDNCYDSGTCDEVIYCTDCHQEISRVTGAICNNATHNFVNEYCSKCGQYENPTSNLKIDYREAGSQYVNKAPDFAGYVSFKYSGYYIKGFDASYSQSDIIDIHLPSVYIDEKGTKNPIVGIDPYAFLNYSFNLVDIPSTYKIIMDSAFCYSTVNNLKLNEGLTDIEEYAFELADNGNKIYIPSTVNNIGSHAFQYSNLSYERKNHNSLVFLGNRPANIQDNSLFGSFYFYDSKKQSWPTNSGTMAYGGYAVDVNTPTKVTYDDSLLTNQLEKYTLGAKEYINTFYTSEKIADYQWLDWFDYTNNDTERNFFINLAEQIVSDSECSSQEDKIMAVYDWVKNVQWGGSYGITYDMKAMNYNLYEAVLDKKGVCAQFAGIMLQLLHSLNIPSFFIEGYLFDDKDTNEESFPQTIEEAFTDRTLEGHAWLIAFDGSEWKYYDPTNDAIFSIDQYSYNRMSEWHGGVHQTLYYLTCSIDGSSFYTDGMNPYRPYYTNNMVYYNSKWYFTNSESYLIPEVDYYWHVTGYSQFTDNTKTIFIYTFDSNGDLKTGLIEFNYENYYVLETGRCIRNCTKEINGQTYRFDSESIGQIES